MIELKCETEGGIRLMKGDQMDMLLRSISSERAPLEIQLKIYTVWWYFCRITGIPVNEILEVDHTPVHFRISSCDGMIDRQSHLPVNRATGMGSPNSVWEEQIWVGEFSVSLEGLAFETGISRKEASVLPVTLAFLNAIDNGFIQIGGGGSSGKGVVRIGNLDEVEAAIKAVPQSRGRCKRGHLAPRKKFSFGGNCKCGAEIRPAWTIPPGYQV